MAEQADGLGDIRQRISRIFPDMEWPEFPWTTGSHVVAVNLEHAANLFALFPKWQGDWDNFIPTMTMAGYEVSDLPKARVGTIAEYAIERVQALAEERSLKGLPIAGHLGTSVSSLALPPIASPVAAPAEDEYASLARKDFKSSHWKILEVCVRYGFLDLATAESADHITALVAGNGSRAARGDVGDLRRYFDFLSRHGFLCSQRGVGTYVTPRGISVVKSRTEGRVGVVRVV
jgi:hypothetical protein